MQITLHPGQSGFIYYSLFGLVFGYKIIQLLFSYTAYRKVRHPLSHAVKYWSMAVPGLIAFSALTIVARPPSSSIVFEMVVWAGLYISLALVMRGFGEMQRIHVPRHLVLVGVLSTLAYGAMLLVRNEYWFRFSCVTVMQSIMFALFLRQTIQSMKNATRVKVSQGLWVVSGVALFTSALLRLVSASVQGSDFVPIFALQPNDFSRLYGMTIIGVLTAGMAFVLDALEKVLEVTQHAERFDELTGLVNRRAIMAQGQREVEHALRNGHGMVVALVDVDFFKRVNDTFGHDVGDQVLVEVAQQLRAERREADLVGRYGGEEFLVIFPGEERAEILGQRLVEHVRAHDFGKMPKATISVGLAVLRPGASEASWSTLLLRADEALYAAKRSGRDRAVVHDAAASGALVEPTVNAQTA